MENIAYFHQPGKQAERTGIARPHFLFRNAMAAQGFPCMDSRDIYIYI